MFPSLTRAIFVLLGGIVIGTAWTPAGAVQLVMNPDFVGTVDSIQYWSVSGYHTPTYYPYGYETGPSPSYYQGSLPNGATGAGYFSAFNQSGVAPVVSQSISNFIIGDTYNLQFYGGCGSSTSTYINTCNITSEIGGVALGTNSFSNGMFNQVNYSFVASSTSSILSFTINDVTGNYDSGLLTEVSLIDAGAGAATGSSSVPEPTALSVLGGGLLGLWFQRRRLKESSARLERKLAGTAGAPPIAI